MEKVELNSTSCPVSHTDLESGSRSFTPPAFSLNASPVQQVSQLKPDSLGGEEPPLSLSEILSPDIMELEDIEAEIMRINSWLAEKRGRAETKKIKSTLRRLKREQKMLANYDGVEQKGHNQRGLMSETGEMTRAILKKIGYNDPKAYYREMVSIYLFGQVAKGIRPEFAEKLKKAEKRILRNLAAKDPKLADPRRARDFLGINESYKTSRAYDSKKENLHYQSMHLFGLAIDINYFNNPWITQDSSRGKSIRKFKSFLGNIDKLFNSNIAASYSYKKSNEQGGGKDEMMDVYDGFASIDEKVELYFSLLDNPGKLQAYLDASESSMWKGISTSKAKKIIKKDLAVISKQSSRGGYKERNFKKEGIMDLKRVLVEGMADADLEWGGKFGDFMHFDMRFSGIGSRIQQAKPQVGRLTSRLRAKSKENKRIRTAD